MKIYLSLIFILYLILNCITTTYCQAAQCSVNELYYNSSGPSPMCDVNCQNLQRQCPLTFIRPVAGCYCRPQYARNLQQRCIPRKQCVGDCGRNEEAIAPLPRGCEKICPVSPTALRISICYRIQERRCVCRIQFCRNRSGQCVPNY